MLRIGNNKGASIYLVLFIFLSCGELKPVTVNWPEPKMLPNAIIGVNDIGKKVGPLKSMSRNYPTSPGCIYLSNGLLIKGLVWLQPCSRYFKGSTIKPIVEVVTKPWNSLSLGDLKDSTIFRKLKILCVDSVRFYDISTPYNLNNSTLYINYHNEDYWRLIVSSKTIKIYDVSDVGLEDISAYTKRLGSVKKMILVNNADTLILARSNLFYLNENSIKRNIKAFIKARYKYSGFISDNIGPLLQYILKQETIY
ncbi:hypothetical protein [Rhizosphaericola mali]|uniref:Uncharacterized protein n=1 Tax=Rhizosphaericola mali TaxID=2545455 RepID=A0A5P2G1Z1_9BACT|nr:hypothetical protein [Rhizosphaericola mali]QES88109.1 hypothetical protein E0W69_005325 [Rhizosphaericola mali]